MTQPLIHTSKGNLPLDELREVVVWSDMETPLRQAKAAILQRIAELETVVLQQDYMAFYAAMQALKAQAQLHVQLDEIICNVEHYQGDELVRRQCNVKKLVGNSADGFATQLG